MAIVYLLPGLLKQGDLVSVDWHDRPTGRRGVVSATPELLNYTSDAAGEKTSKADKERGRTRNDKVWRIDLLLMDPDAGQDPQAWTIYRGVDEMLQVITEHEQHTEGMRGHRERPPASIPGQGTKGKGTLEE